MSLKYVLITRRETRILPGGTVRSVPRADGETGAMDYRQRRFQIDKRDEIIGRCKHAILDKLMRMPGNRDRARLPLRRTASTYDVFVFERSPTTSSVILMPTSPFEAGLFQCLLGGYRTSKRRCRRGRRLLRTDDLYGYRFAEHRACIRCVPAVQKCFPRMLVKICPNKGRRHRLVAVTTARMKGWQTRTFTDKYCFIIAKDGHCKREHLCGPI